MFLKAFKRQSKLTKTSYKSIIFQEDQLEAFKKPDSITSLDDIIENQMKYLDGSSFLEKKKCATIFSYQLEKLPRGASVVTHWVRVDRITRVEIYHKAILMPLPSLFWTGVNYSGLSSSSMVSNFITHILLAWFGLSSSWAQFYPVISAYALTVPLPSVSHLKILTSGESTRRERFVMAR